jgi:hypothetical protein
MFCFLAVVGAWSSDRKRGYAPRGFHWLVLSEDLADGFLSCRRILFDVIEMAAASFRKIAFRRANF